MATIAPNQNQSTMMATVDDTFNIRYYYYDYYYQYYYIEQIQKIFIEAFAFLFRLFLSFCCECCCDVFSIHPNMIIMRTEAK